MQADLRICRSRGGGTECPRGPCPSNRGGTAEGVEIGSDGASQRSDGDEDRKAVSAPEEKALLGQSFLGKGHYVATVGMDAGMIREYVQMSGKKEREIEQLRLDI